MSSQDSSDDARSVGGTIRWQAPELLNPEIENPRASVESDVYSFGCVLYEVSLIDILHFILVDYPGILGLRRQISFL